MSKSAVNARAKALKKENAAKKAKRKIISITGICVLIVLIAVLSVLFLRNQNDTEVFSYNGQTVRLSADGTFTANLAHNVNKSGTYTRVTESGWTLVYFYVNGNEEIGSIANNVLTLPDEWNDGHGHGTVFPKVN
ncbi:MAG: hypothetical protein FWC06_03735 [Treponema sp.]|nr:hypothetical protein [Treponema sp.]